MYQGLELVEKILQNSTLLATLMTDGRPTNKQKFDFFSRNELCLMYVLHTAADGVPVQDTQLSFLQG